MAGRRTRGRGELAEEILRLLRDHAQPASAGELQEMFAGNRPAYTTLLTVLSRLEEKGEVTRISESPRRVTFQPVHSDEEHSSQVMLSALGKASDRRATLLAFAGDLNEEDMALLQASFHRR